jgi:hypothetical protein
MASVTIGRIRKTLLWLFNRERYWEDLAWDLAALERKAARELLLPSVRLNGTSDIRWEDYVEFRRLADRHPGIVFYDYTKWPKRPKTKRIPNYDLTFSRGDSDKGIRAAVEQGMRVCMVVRADGPLPRKWTVDGLELETVNGDLYDSRFQDPAGSLVLVRAKGEAKGDTSGFVVDITTGGEK